MKGPSAHLSWQDLKCQGPYGTVYPLAWRESRAVLLAEEYEAILALCDGVQIPVASGYRTVSWQRRLAANAERRGLALPCPASFHIRGMALDLYPPAGMGVREFADRIEQRAQQPGSSLRGLGRYPTFVHVDIRPQLSLRRWTGQCTQPDYAWDLDPLRPWPAVPA